VNLNHAGVLKHAGVLAAALLLCASTAQAAPLSRLGHEGRWITDSKGRVVILHGTNMVYKRAPYSSDAIGFGSDDASFLAANGFNYVRLGLIWRAIEPAPGVYDDGYLNRIARTVRVLRRHGVYVLLDFHQDLYNERYEGEGAPDWAIVGQAAGEGSGTQAGFPANYLVNEPLNHAFDAFWANTEVPGSGRGVQDFYAAAWRHVASRFRGTRGLVGYNLFNEPWGGSVVRNCALTTPPVTPSGNCPPASELERRALTAFHRRVIGAIREADRRTLAWYAPYLTFDFGLRSSHRDTGDRNAGFAFNAYCGQANPLTAAVLPFAAGKPCSYTAELSFDNADAVSRRTGDALLDTELGASDAAKDWVPYLAAADRHMVGWAYWAYCGCADPTGSVPPDLEALVLDPARPPRGANLKRAKLRLLARPYPSLVSGTPRSFRFRPASGRFALRYSTRRAGLRTRFKAGSVTEVVVPRVQYPRGYRVSVRGARVVSRTGARVLRLESCSDAGDVSVRVTRGLAVPASRRSAAC
jgi:endoglycosylceramidase